MLSSAIYFTLLSGKFFVPAKLPCLHFHPSLLPLYDVIIVRELVYNTEMVEMGIIIETAFIFV